MSSSTFTVGKNPSFFVIFVKKGKFSDILAYPGKMSIKLAKKAPIPRVSIHNLSFETNLTNIFKYLVPKTVRQNSLIRSFSGLKNRQNSEFCRTVLDSRYLNLLFKLGSNDRL